MPRIPCLRKILIVLIGALAVGAPVRAELDFTVLGNGFTGLPYVVRDDIVLETTGLGEGIRDYSDLKNPRWIGWNSHEFSLWWSRVLIDDGLLVGINSEFGFGPVGFSLNDFRNPSDPSELSITTGFSAESGWLRDGALLLCDEYVGVTYDLADPANPRFSSVLLLGIHEGDRWPAEDGNTLFLVDGGSDIRVLDVTDPLVPVDQGSVSPVAGRIDGMAAGDGHLHLLVATDIPGGGSNLDLVTLNVGDPLAPVLTGRQRLVSGADAAGRTVVAADDLLLVSAAGIGVQAFGLADPAFPAPGWVLEHDTDHVQISASAIFLKADADLFVYERKPHDSYPALRFHRTVLPEFRSITGEGPVQIAQVDDELVTIDASEPNQPRLEKTIDIGLSGHLHFANGRGVMREPESLDFRILDLEDPRNPRKLGLIPWAGYRSHLGSFSGDVLIINALEEIPKQPGWYSPKVLVYDCRDPLRPHQTARFTENHVQFCDGDWMLSGWTNPISIYRFDDDLVPVHYADLESQIDDIPRALVIKDCVYLIGRERGGGYEYEVHRLGTEPNPVARGSLDLVPRQVDHHQGFLFIQGHRECQVFDVSDPTSPESIGSFPTLGGLGFATNGDVVTISSSLVTVRIHDALPAHTPTPATASGVRMDPARPNPFNPTTNISFAVDRARELTVGIYDSRGRLVRRLVSGHFEAGTHSVSWNGEAQGAPAASGVYFVRVHGPGVEAVQAVTMLK